jgi:hypothetical protein
MGYWRCLSIHLEDLTMYVYGACLIRTRNCLSFASTLVILGFFVRSMLLIPLLCFIVLSLFLLCFYFFLTSFCVLCTQCCQCLCIVHSWFPFRFSLTLIFVVFQLECCTSTAQLIYYLPEIWRRKQDNYFIWALGVSVLYLLGLDLMVI